METGKWSQDQIEVHSVPNNLIGYHSDVRSDRANIIIRRRYIGGSSNDIGFLKTEDGTYTAIISEYDSSKYNKQWLNRLKQNYAYHTIKEQQENRGRMVTREHIGNRQRISIRGYR
jgi:hypothetical protein